MTAHYSVERGSWTAADALAPVQEVGSADPQLARAPSGTGVAIWLSGSAIGWSAIWAARYEAKAGRWRDVQAIGEEAEMAVPSDDSSAVGEFVEVAAMRGRALAVWSRDGSSIVASQLR